MNLIPFHILLALARQDATAGELFAQIREDTEDSVWIAESSFYSALTGLVRKNWVSQSGKGRQARYHLLATGRKQLIWDGSRVKRAAMLLRERL